MQVMIDLETLGTSADSMILTFGAVAFNPTTGVNASTFYEKVNVDSYKKYNPFFSMDSSTLWWWLTQAPQVARLEAFSETDRLPIEEVIQKFIDWSSKYKFIRCWSHGSCFDISIASYTMKKLQEYGVITKSFSPDICNFWDVRDTRTLYELGGIHFKSVSYPESAAFPEHHALGDCYKQIQAVKMAYANLKR